MFAAYEYLPCMNVEFVATNICCDRYLLRSVFVVYEYLLCMNVAFVATNVCCVSMSIVNECSVCCNQCSLRMDVVYEF